MSAQVAIIFRCEGCSMVEGLAQGQHESLPPHWLSLPAIPGLTRARTHFCEACAGILRARMGRQADHPETHNLQRRA